MRNWVMGAVAMLSATASQAQGVGETYATVGPWEITASNRACMMQRSFTLRNNGDEQTLVIYYDAQRRGVLLGWGTHKPKLPPLSHSLDFDLAFTRKGGSRNQTWGSQPFKIDKVGAEYRYSHAFIRATDADRFLRDFASSESIALWLGPSLMMSLPTSASDAVAKLQECSATIVAQQDAGDHLPTGRP